MIDASPPPALPEPETLALASPPRAAATQQGELLSPSQVRCFMDCQARWWFKYGLKIPEVATAGMVLGKAVHTALAENFAQKIDTREDLPTEGVIAVFREAWTREAKHTEFLDEEDPGELAANGVGLIEHYMSFKAPTVDPAAVELHVEGEIAGVQVQGWIDLLDAHGRVIDFKTAKAKPTTIEPMHKFQVATYAHLLPGAHREGRIDTLLKTRLPWAISQTFLITEEELKVPETIYPAAQRAMRQQCYLPNRLSMLCSRRHCSYWRHCEREWGGEVPET
jgi:CRISPR/Cas system-associated exonuclease Cas4 (RecB family)